MRKKNYYDILGVKPAASPQEIRDAYRKLSKKIHPDVNNNDKYFEEYFKSIQEAYEVLFNDNSRKKYDVNNDSSTNHNEAEIINLRQSNFNLESRNKELNTKIQEIYAEKNSVKYELENYKQNYFATNSKVGILSNKIRELESKLANLNTSATKSEDDEIENYKQKLFEANLKVGILYNRIKELESSEDDKTNSGAWILVIIASLWLIGYIFMNYKKLNL
jgi:curved DNA-binding protein CbpA